MELLTTSDMAKTLHEPRERIEYGLRRCGLIPASRVGPIRLYEPDTLAAVRKFLRLVDTGQRPAPVETIQRRTVAGHVAR